MVISDLLWRRPRHYMDVDETHDRVHWVELFFDLVHVVTIFILGNYLSHHLGWQGFWCLRDCSWRFSMLGRQFGL